jgi:hypothetical protein
VTDGPLLPQDLALLARISAGNDWLRSLLCTLARRGTRLRQSEPQRASEVIRRLAPLPWFKGGQFLFDLMEWEDFMVDGPPPPPLSDVLQTENWQRIDELLAKIRALLVTAHEDSVAAAPAPGSVEPLMGAVTTAHPDDADLPPLEPGLHLYRDVVLGVWASTTSGPAAPGS